MRGNDENIILVLFQGLLFNYSLFLNTYNNTNTVLIMILIISKYLKVISTFQWIFLPSNQSPYFCIELNQSSVILRGTISIVVLDTKSLFVQLS